MKVTVRFLDGEELEGESDSVNLQKLGFPVVVAGTNNRTVWVSLAAIKYVVLRPVRSPGKAGEGDPRADLKLPKVVLHFLDGDTLRTYQDEHFGQQGEGFHLRAWDPKRSSLVDVVASMHALKGIFFVDDWDSRDDAQRRVDSVRVRQDKRLEVPVAWTDEEVLDVDPEIRRMARNYQRRLALERDLQLAGDPAAFERAVRSGLDRLLEEDLIALRPGQKDMLATFILRDAIGYGPLDPLLRDPTVSEIMVNAPDEIFIERGGQMLRSQARFEDVSQLLNVIRRMAATVARRVDESSPMVDARLPDGSRLNAVLPPAALRGPTLTIRKFRSFDLGLDEFVREGTLSGPMARFLQGAVTGRLSILISGGTGSGKTTTLNVLGSQIPNRERVVTIEDAAELQLTHSHVVGLEYRPPNIEGKGELTIRALLRNSLRMRPDRVIVGEVRDAAAIDMLQAMNTGHDGSMSTIHANSARDAFSRLETMVLSGSVELPLNAVRAQIASAVNLVVHQARLPDGSRRVVQISELTGYQNDTPVLLDIFRFERAEDGTGWWVATGHRPAGLKKMGFYGVTVPEEIFEARREALVVAPGKVEAAPAAAATPSAESTASGSVPGAGGPAADTPTSDPPAPGTAIGPVPVPATPVPVPATPVPIPATPVPSPANPVPPLAGAEHAPPSQREPEEPAAIAPPVAPMAAGGAASALVPTPASEPPTGAVASPQVAPPGPDHHSAAESTTLPRQRNVRPADRILERSKPAPAGSGLPRAPRPATPGGLHRRAEQRTKLPEDFEPPPEPAVKPAAKAKPDKRRAMRSRIAETLGTPPVKQGDPS